MMRAGGQVFHRREITRIHRKIRGWRRVIARISVTSPIAPLTSTFLPAATQRENRRLFASEVCSGPQALPALGAPATRYGSNTLWN
jgi:hypothetical protein